MQQTVPAKACFLCALTYVSLKWKLVSRRMSSSSDEEMDDSNASSSESGSDSECSQALVSSSVSKFAFAFPASRKGVETHKKKADGLIDVHHMFSELLCRVHELQVRAFEAVFDSLVGWVASGASKAERADTKLRCCALLLGVNLPDHSHLFDVIKSKLSSHSKVASIKACYDDAKDLTKALAAQLSVKRLRDLATNSSITVIVQDLEAFKAQNLLNLFIQLIDVGSERNIDFKLILGLATSMSVLHQLLPHHLLDQMTIERLPVGHKATHVLHDVCQLIMLECGQIRLSGPVLQLLIEIFTHHDLAVNTFIHNYKFCVADHLRRFPFSPSLSDPKVLKKAINGLTEDDRTRLCQLPSMKKIDTNLGGLVGDKKRFNKLLKESMINLLETSNIFNCLIKAIHQLVSDVSGAPLGKQIYSLMWRSLSGDVRSLPEYTELYSKLQRLNPEIMRTKLESLSCTLKVGADELGNPLSQCYEETLQFCKELDEAINAEKMEKLGSSKNETSALNKSPPKKAKISRHTLQKMMLERAKSESSSTSRHFEDLRGRIVRELFHEKLFFHLDKNNPCKLPFHEILYYSNLRTARQQLVPAPRATLHSALTNSNIYIKNVEHTDVGDAFKIYQESGKLINLYDWLQAWMTLQDTSKVDFDTLHARFTRAVMTLEFLGFVRSPRTSKTDHVTKMTWGSM